MKLTTVISILITTTIITNLTTAIDFEERDYKAGLIFKQISKARVSYESFSIIYHANLAEFFDIKDELGKCLILLKRLCYHEATDSCNTQISLLSHQITFLIASEQDIELYQPGDMTFHRKSKETKRVKRAWESVGTFLHWAFGVMDADTAREYDKKINELQEETHTLRKIEGDSLLFLKENIVTNNKTFSDIKSYMTKLTNLMDQNLNKTIEVINNKSVLSMIQQVVNIAQLWISEHNYISNHILKHLEGAVYGKISQLVPKVQFFEDLRTIENMLPDNQRLPIDIYLENPLNIYKYSSTSASIFDRRLMIEINIPRIDTDSYLAYEITTIPVTLNGFPIIILPNMEYVLINQNTAEYIPLSKKEYDTGIFNVNAEKIIKPNENIYNDYENNCEMKIYMDPTEEAVSSLCNVKVLPVTNYFIPIDLRYKYYLYLSTPIKLIEFCQNKPISTQTITTSGMLKISEDCKIRTEKITLRPRLKTTIKSQKIIELRFEIKNITIDKLTNNIENITTPLDLKMTESVLIQDHIKDYSILASKTDEMVEKILTKKRFEEIHYDKIKSYFWITLMIIVIVIIIVAIVVFILYKRFYHVNTLMKLGEKLNDLDFPTKYVHRIYPTTPKRTSLVSNETETKEYLQIENFTK